MGPGCQVSQPNTWRFSGSPNVRGDTLIRFPPPRNALALADEGVRPALLAEARGAAMARHEDDVVAEGPELLADRAQQRRMVAARQVGPADRAAEQHVADEGEAVRGVEEDHVAGGVS